MFMKLLAHRIISWELYCSHAEWRAVVNAVPLRLYCACATDTPKGLTINVIMLQTRHFRLSQRCC